MLNVEWLAALPPKSQLNIQNLTFNIAASGRRASP
jgi:hypothetical protein